MAVALAKKPDVSFGVPLRPFAARMETLVRGLSERWTIRVIFKEMDAVAYTEGANIYLNPISTWSQTRVSWVNAKRMISIHELSHIMHSDFKGLGSWKATKPPWLRGFAFSVLNSLEDGRIEWVAANRWPGTREWIEAVRTEEYLHGKKEMAKRRRTNPPGALMLTMAHIHSLATMGIKRAGRVPKEEAALIKQCRPHIKKARNGATTQVAMDSTDAILDLLQVAFPDEFLRMKENHVFREELENMLRELLKILGATPGLEGMAPSPLPPEAYTGKGDAVTIRVGKKKPSSMTDSGSSSDSPEEEEGPEEESGEYADDREAASDADVEAELAKLEAAMSEEVEDLIHSLPKENVDPVAAAKTRAEAEIRKNPIHRKIPWSNTVVTRGSAVFVRRIQSSFQTEIRDIEERLKKLLEPKRRETVRERRRGALDASALWKLGAVKETRVFKKTNAPSPERNVAVELLIDASGSMNSNLRVERARETGIILATALARLKVSVKVADFIEADGTVHQRDYVDWGQMDLSPLSELKAGGSNRDGYSIRMAAADLAVRHEPVKLLFVISDGQPAGASYNGEIALLDSRKAVQETRRQGIETFGFFIGSLEAASVAKERFIYGNDIILIHDLRKIPGIMARILEARLRMRLS